jgi:hypothetical protein
MSLYPTFSLHLEYGKFRAACYELEGHDCCVLKIEGEGDDGTNLSLFFPIAHKQVADEMVAKLNDIAAAMLTPSPKQVEPAA